MTTEPASVLVYPEVGSFLDWVNNTTGYSQYISPSYWLGELADWLLGQNPWDEASKMIAGDWKMVAESGAAVAILAKFNMAFSTALSEQNRMVFGDRLWTGKAAKDAYNYFRGLELALGDQVEPLQAIAGEIRKLTLAVNQTQDIIKGLLEDLTDELITLGLSTYVQGFKVLVAAGPQAFAAARAIDKYKEMQKQYEKILLAVKVFVAGLDGNTNDINRHPFKQLSEKGYDHTGVKPPAPKPVARQESSPVGGPGVFYGGFVNRDNNFY